MLTEHYYIFHHTPFYKLSKANVAKIISGASAPGKLMRYYPGASSPPMRRRARALHMKNAGTCVHYTRRTDVPSRMILIPRDGNTPPRFFDTEPCMIYHHCTPSHPISFTTPARMCAQRKDGK
jgi:carotenoid cleavage dioxygenase-like enzyme